MTSPLDALAVELTCSICTEILYQPLTLLDCLHTFCGVCTKRWFLVARPAPAAASAPAGPPCPACRSPVRGTRPNATVTTLLDHFLAARPERARPADERAEIARAYKPGDNVFPAAPAARPTTTATTTTAAAAAATRSVEHQSSLRSLLSVSEADPAEMEERIMRQIADEGLLDGIDISALDEAQEDEITTMIAHAYRRRQRDERRARRAAALEAALADTADTAAAAAAAAAPAAPPAVPSLAISHVDGDGAEDITATRTRTRNRNSSPVPSAGTADDAAVARARPHLRPRPEVRSVSEGAAAATAARRAEEPLLPFADRAVRPPAPRTARALSDARSLRPAVAALGRQSPSPTHQRLSMSLSLSPAQLQPAPRRRTIGAPDRPGLPAVGAAATDDRCARCDRPDVLSRLHFRCVAGCAGAVVCKRCYGGGGRCPVEPGHDLQGVRPARAGPGKKERSDEAVDDSEEEELVGLFCAGCDEPANGCFWKCEVCNADGGAWGFCNGCVLRARHCAHPLLPLRAVGPVVPVPPLPTGAELVRTGARARVGGLEMQPLVFEFRCRLCGQPIGPGRDRVHCPDCDGGRFQACVPCYRAAVSGGEAGKEKEKEREKRRVCPVDGAHRTDVVAFVLSGREGEPGQDGWRPRYRVVLESGVRPEGAGDGGDGDDEHGRRRWAWREPGGRAGSATVRDGSGARAVAVWPWIPAEDGAGELAFPAGALVLDHADINGDWAWGSYARRAGLFPASRVRPCE